MDIDHRHRPQQHTWNNGLCNCGEDVSTCFVTCLLPCVTFGQIAEVVDEGKSSCVGQGIIYGLAMMIQCHWLCSCMYREKLRSKFGLRGDACGDCCIHCCCEPCALCQEHAELKSRGYNPSIGWIGPPNAPPVQMMPPSMNK
ncbi:cell number regulator 2-like [Ziziphus jujuba]|uniref:Cell number regulator 2-like n=1 Tax=Ziziphus jujuba TaxID=326968 RepID=A0A6P6FR81_ZIZJJ|nr:cell number regulator 2-like [Ziziphus jujuba]